MWSNTEAIEEFSGFLQSTSGQQCGTNYNLTVYNSLWKSDLEKQQLKDSTTMSDQIYRALEKTHGTIWHSNCSESIGLVFDKYLQMENIYIIMYCRECINGIINH